ncbi:MAG: flagellar hook-associated protein FlgL [Firmicutes bacterium]|nr:flagellar hook-associated protein FlgL [Bacillota bacterium]
MRVTNQMIVTNSLNNLNRGLERMHYLSHRLAAGKKLLVPSDDPIGTGNIMNMYRGLAETRQYVTNADYGIGIMQAADGAFVNMTETLQRARELAVYGASSTLPQDSREALAKEVDELLDHAVQIANSTYTDVYIFGGQEVTKPPFTIITETDEEGNEIIVDVEMQDSSAAGTSINIEIGPASELEISIPGNKAFADIFDRLIALSGNLRSGEEGQIEVSETSIGELEDSIAQVLRYQAEIGAKTKRLEITKSRLEELDINLQTLISKTEDIDVAESIMEYKMYENAYRLALDTTARSVQPTLLDFLR